MMLAHYHVEKNFFDEPIDSNEIYIYQIGRLHCDKAEPINDHMHSNLFELTVVTGGEGFVAANGVKTAVKAGDIYLSMPHERHSIISDKTNPLKYDFFAFMPRGEEFAKEFKALSQSCRSPYSRVFVCAQIPPLISSAVNELESSNLFSRELLAAMFTQILIYTLRSFQKSSDIYDVDNVSSTEILCYKMMNYIENNIFSIKSLSELSEVTGYSYGYLSSVFKKTANQTLLSFYNEKKFEKAKAMLADKKIKINEIAEKLGYSSLYAFSKAFKEFCGMSPTQYRKNKKI